MLTLKAKEEFLNYYWANYIGKTRLLSQKSETEDFFNSLFQILQTALITEWFDAIGITVDVMPRMADDNKIVFEPNTFCLKYEIGTEDFIQFETRQEAIENAIIQANVIFNIHFVAE
jgi:hypothetical protein